MWKRRFLRFVLCLLPLSILGGTALTWIGSDKFIVPRRRALEDRHLEAIRNPREFGFELESFQAVTDDGLKLEASLISPSKQPGAAVKTRRMQERLGLSETIASMPSPGTVVMLHGRGGLKEDMFPIAERFVAAGFRCIAYDARAHGQSEGAFTTYGYRETHDLSAVIDSAAGRFGHRLEPFLAFGNSQGAAVVIQALPEEARIRAAVTVSPFAELNTQAHLAVRNAIGEWPPEFLTRIVTTIGGWRAGFDPGKIQPADAARRIQVPVMVVHGGRDRVIPPAQGLFVFEAMSDPAKVWREVPEGYHFNVLATGNDDLYQEMIEFWLEALRERPPSETESVPVQSKARRDSPKNKKIARNFPPFARLASY